MSRVRKSIIQSKYRLGLRGSKWSTHQKSHSIIDEISPTHLNKSLDKIQQGKRDNSYNPDEETPHPQRFYF